MAELKIKADSGGGTVSFKGPATTTSNAAVQLTLPVDDGTADQYLKTDGSGALSWATVSAGAGGATALSLNDGVKANFGTDDDLRIYGGSGNSFIQHQDTGAGDLYIDAQNSNVYIRSGDGGTNEENAIVCENNSKVKLYHSGTHVAETSANGLAFPDGKGIDFSATAGPTNATGSTGTSELFDDYEEGTWTPVFSGASNLGSYSHQDGYYIKVGRVCHAWYYVRVDRGTSTSNAKIFGLPFDADHESVIWPVRHAYGGTAVHNIWGECQNNGDWIRFFRQDGTLTDTTNYYWDFGYVNANAYVALSGTITYRTD